MSKDIDFTDCTLYASPRSPFARRVRVALQENGIAHSERLVDVIQPNQEVIPHNLLSRVPTLVLKTGENLVESHLILGELYREMESVFQPKTKAGRLKALLWTGYATGIMEKSVDFFFESLRPESRRDQELIDELYGIYSRFLKGLDQELAGREYLVEDRLTQADFDLAIALTYLEFRVPKAGLANYPRLIAYRNRLEERPSFKKTRPQ